MKKWNTPAIDTLNVEATANGALDSEWETRYLLNDNLKKSVTPVTPVTPETPETTVDELS